MVNERSVTGSSQSSRCLRSIWTATRSHSTVMTQWFHSTADWVTSLSQAVPITCRSALRIPDSQSCEVLQAAFSWGTFCENEFLFTDAIFISELFREFQLNLVLGVYNKNSYYGLWISFGLYSLPIPLLYIQLKQILTGKVVHKMLSVWSIKFIF
jgi:hypothetical protein